MDTGTDYDVRTRVSFKLDFDGSGELNLLASRMIRSEAMFRAI